MGRARTSAGDSTTPAPPPPIVVNGSCSVPVTLFIADPVIGTTTLTYNRQVGSTFFWNGCTSYNFPGCVGPPSVPAVTTAVFYEMSLATPPDSQVVIKYPQSGTPGNPGPGTCGGSMTGWFSATCSNPVSGCNPSFGSSAAARQWRRVRQRETLLRSGCHRPHSSLMRTCGWILGIPCAAASRVGPARHCSAGQRAFLPRRVAGEECSTPSSSPSMSGRFQRRGFG